MKKYLIRIILFFIAVAVIDVLFGFVCQYMNSHSKGGGVKSRYYVCKESHEDVLVFGSSRAKHHYVPDIIEDSLGMSCYNTGEDGNGIIYCYGVLKMITQRYSPKLIIYDVSDFDMYEDDNMKYLDLLKPYYHESGVDSMFWAIEPKTRLMMQSNLYRYNTSCLRVLGNYIRPISNYPKGYDALYGTMNYEPKPHYPILQTIDTLKIKYFEDFIKLTQDKEIIIICCVSPSYNGVRDNGYFAPIKKLCILYEIPFLYFNDEYFLTGDRTLFKDRTHMNDKGAQKFTRILMNYINNEGMFYKLTH